MILPGPCLLLPVCAMVSVLLSWNFPGNLFLPKPSRFVFILTWTELCQGIFPGRRPVLCSWLVSP